MRINPLIYGILVLVVFMGVVFGFQQAGLWSTSGKINASGEAIQPSAMDMNTIKGWMTLEQVSSTFNVPIAEIISNFDLPSDTPVSTPLKDLESDTFNITILRAWLQEKLVSP
jgi:hypothetical protein